MSGIVPFAHPDQRLGESFYFDGTAVFKVFYPQLGSEIVDHILDRRSNIIFTTPLAQLEALSYLAGFLSRGIIFSERYHEVARAMASFIDRWTTEGRIRMLEPHLDHITMVDDVLRQSAQLRQPLSAGEAVHAVLARSVRPGPIALLSTSDVLLAQADRMGLIGLKLEPIG